METWKGKRTFSGATYNSDAMSLTTTDTTIGRAKASNRTRRNDEEDGKKKREKQNAYRSAEGTKRKRGNAAMSHRRLEGNDKNAHEDTEQIDNLDGEKAGRNHYPDGTTRTRETDAARHTREKRKVPGDAERSYYPDGTERTRMSDAERHKEKPLRINAIGDAERTCYPDGTQRTRETDAARHPRTKKTHNIIIATQNFNGIRKHDRESVKEEMVLQMKRYNIDILCCQETSLPTTSDERWDSEEIMLGGGIEETRYVSKHSKASNCFLLSKHMSTLFEKGGKQYKRYSRRLATIRIPVGTQNLYIINCHFPESGQGKKRAREALHLQYETALQAKRDRDILIVIGDFNAALGNGDTICGQHGLKRRNEEGDALRVTAHIYDLRDLVTFEKQAFDGTWIHPQSKLSHQCDHVFMQAQEQHKVKKCINAPMLAETDHYSMRLHLRVTPPVKKSRTQRQERVGKDVKGQISMEGHPEKRRRFVNDVLQHFGLQTDEQEKMSVQEVYTQIMTAIGKAVDDMKAPEKKVYGWCDLNDAELIHLIDTRNKASIAWAKDRSKMVHRHLQEARKALKKKKKDLKNKWLMEMLQAVNGSLLPGGPDQKRGAAMWKMAQKLQRGCNKWKKWDRKNIQNKDGILGTTPEENAERFQEYYTELFENKVEESSPAYTEYEEMPSVSTDRQWMPPTKHEMVRAIKELKDTAPGISGIQSCVWKAILAEEGNIEIRPIEGVQAGEGMMEALLGMIRKCWNEAKVPDEWNKYHMTILPKKGDLTLPKNYRGISMAETCSKIYTTILKHRLMQLYETLAPEYSAGFRKGRGRNDCIYVAKETCRQRKAHGLETHAIFWDLCKAFDTIPREFIWLSMRKMGVEEKMIRAVQATLKGTECWMTVDGVTRKVPMAQGSAQGTSLGPTLFLYFFLPILDRFNEKMKQFHTYTHTKDGERFSTFLHNFADDTLMLTGSREDTVKVIQAFDAYIKKFQMTVHKATIENPVSKSVVIYMPANEKQKAEHDDEPIRVKEGVDEWLNFVDEYVYLGATMTSGNNDTIDMRRRIKKAVQMYGMLRPKLMGDKDTTVQVKKRILESMILPTMLDGAETWVITSGMMIELTTAYNKMVRSSLRYTTNTQRKYAITSEKTYELLQVKPLQYYIDWKILGYAGHVQRMEEKRLPQRIRDADFRSQGKKHSGGQRKTHTRQIHECLRRKTIPTEGHRLVAMNRDEWNAAIKGNVNLRPRYSLRNGESQARRDIRNAPNRILGNRVEKKYGNTYHVGTITDTTMDAETNEQIWGVLWDDGDWGDYNVYEIEKIMDIGMEAISVQEEGLQRSDNIGQYTIEHICQMPNKAGLYEVKWIGWEEEHNTFEPKENIPDTFFEDTSH